MKFEFKPNKLTFDSAGCLRAIQMMAEAYMNMTGDKMIEIMRQQIDRLGNGSSEMKSDAKKAVREILREVVHDHITLEIGVDEAMAKSMSEQFYVRTMVVLHGNQASGPIHTKPGQATWNKHVNSKGPSTAKSVYPIEQFDWRLDYSQSIVDNTMKEIEKYFRDMLQSLAKSCDAAFFASFLR